MSQELQIGGSLSFSKGGASLSTLFASGFFDVAGSAVIKQTAAIGITDESLVLGDVSSIGYVALKNLDATNSIIIGSDGTLYPIILRANGGWAIVDWNAAAIHAKANTAPCNLEYTIISD
jgi:hypothetical protein